MMTRSVAVKLRISDIADGKFVKSADRWEPNYLVMSWNDKITRLRVLATVVSKFTSDEKNYGTITLDDGSDTISVRAFKEGRKMLDDIEIGDIVDVIGRVKEYQEERYITPEIILRLDDPNWELVRRLELLKAMRSRGGAKMPAQQADFKIDMVSRVAKLATVPEAGDIEVVEEVLDGKVVAQSSNGQSTKKEPSKGNDGKSIVLKIIKEMDEGDGVKYITLLKEVKLTEDALDALLDELMQDGYVYEPKIGRFKGV